MLDDVARHLAHGVLAGPDRKASNWTAHPDPVNLHASGPSGRRDSLAHKFGDIWVIDDQRAACGREHVSLWPSARAAAPGLSAG
jgi:hypothetical protein